MEVTPKEPRHADPFLDAVIDYLTFDGSTGIFDAHECAQARGRVLSMLPAGAIAARREKFMRELTGAARIPYRRRSPTKEEQFAISCVAAAVSEVFSVGFREVAMTAGKHGDAPGVHEARMAFRLMLADCCGISWKSQSKLFGAVERSTIRESNRNARRLILEKATERDARFAETLAKAKMRYVEYSSGLLPVKEAITTYNKLVDMYE